ncbi:16512_t:CDS:2 [Gigaspora rosea]|nr:16512_t:CDS:2 [Gigaspora rosea]
MYMDICPNKSLDMGSLWTVNVHVHSLDMTWTYLLYVHGHELSMSIDNTGDSIEVIFKTIMLDSNMGISNYCDWHHTRKSENLSKYRLKIILANLKFYRRFRISAINEFVNPMNPAFHHCENSDNMRNSWITN